MGNACTYKDGSTRNRNKKSRKNELIDKVKRGKTLELTPDEKLDLAKIWNELEDSRSIAVEVFIRLFENDKALKWLFADFAKLKSTEDMRESAIFGDHAENVFLTIDGVVKYAVKIKEDREEFEKELDHLAAIGQFHKNMGMSARLFQSITQPFLSTFTERYGEKFTADASSGLSKVIVFVVRCFRDEYMKSATV